MSREYLDTDPTTTADFLPADGRQGPDFPDDDDGFEGWLASAGPLTEVEIEAARKCWDSW